MRPQYRNILLTVAVRFPLAYRFYLAVFDFLWDDFHPLPLLCQRDFYTSKTKINIIPFICCVATKTINFNSIHSNYSDLFLQRLFLL